jgi:two-component system, cell cycle response regulator
MNPKDTTDILPLGEECEKQIFDLKQLFEISKSLNSTLDYNILIESILYTIMGQMKVLKAALYAKKGIDSTRFNLHRNYKGFEIEHEIDYSIAEDAQAMRLFARETRCWTLPELHRRLGSYGGLESLESLDTCLIVPLKAKGVVNGLIILGEQIESEEFSAYEKDYLFDIAILASIAINNAFLFEMTTTDMMTKLRLKHYFYTALIDKMEESAFSGKPLSVIMCDIDFFKKFNDTYGHGCGDEVLKRVAKLLQNQIRSVDVAARYGGEEFCALMPDTDLRSAMLVAERIRQSVESTVFEYESQSMHITLSLGVAVYDMNRDMSAKAVIDRADKALYQSKQTGRNKTTEAH